MDRWHRGDLHTAVWYRRTDALGEVHTQLMSSAVRVTLTAHVGAVRQRRCVSCVNREVTTLKTER